MVFIYGHEISPAVLAGIIYLSIISIITFFYFGFDKARALRPGATRIRERTLWILSAIGGSPGALMAMKFFRHKTQKSSFQLVMILILLLQLSCIFLLLQYFTNS
jgi:uncharacterized membrane protein YsdA (DUF1294 family)